MPPKKHFVKAAVRGLLGAEAYQSDADSDYRPGDDSTGDERRNKPKRGARKGARGKRESDDAAAQRQTRGSKRQRSAASSDSSDEDELLRSRAARLGKKAAVAARGATAAAAAAAGASAAATAGASRRDATTALHSAAAAAAGERRDWGGLTAPLLRAVLWRACAASALLTAAAAPRVCRHWRAVCRDIEADAVAAAAAAAAAGGAAGGPAEAGAAAAAAAGGPAAEAAAAGAAAHAARGEAAAAAAAGNGPSDGGGGGGLWGCLDVRCRPGARFTDEVIARGVASRRWTQVHTLRLGGVGAGGGGGLTPEGLLAFARCAGRSLRALELTQCDGLVRPELRVALAALPCLTHLDLSCSLMTGIDAVLRAALAPRAAAPPPPAGGRAGGAGDADGGGGGGGGGAGAGAGGGGGLPGVCALRVLRARECAWLGPGTLKALTPDPPPPPPPPLPPLVDYADDDPANPPPPPPPPPPPLLPHLTELDLTASGGRAAPLVLAVERLQAAAPALRVLRLDAAGPAMYLRGLELGPEPRAPGPGFPHLRECQLGLSRAQSVVPGAVTVCRHSCTLALVRRVAGRSPRLRELDVSGAMSGADSATLSHQAAEPEAGDGAEWRRRDAAAARVEAAVAAAMAALPAAARNGGGDGGGGRGGELLQAEWRRRLRHCLPAAADGGGAPLWFLGQRLRVLRASRSVLASDAGLHAIAARLGASLQVLDVSLSPHVTDAGLLHVAVHCTALTVLDVSSTGVTDWGVRRLLALRAPSGGAAAAAAVAAAAAPGRVHGSGGGGHVADPASDTDSDGGGDDRGGDAADRGGDCVRQQSSAGAAAALVSLDIGSCRGVDRATRHAAAQGLGALRRHLRV